VQARPAVGNREITICFVLLRRPYVVARAFDPPFTTKPPGKAQALDFRRSMASSSKNRRGRHHRHCSRQRHTRVNIALPKAHANASSERRESGHAPGGFEAILIVDDDPDVRQIMSSVLSDLGYE
jgi:hypothetical protein